MIQQLYSWVIISKTLIQKGMHPTVYAVLFTVAKIWK